MCIVFFQAFSSPNADGSQSGPSDSVGADVGGIDQPRTETGDRHTPASASESVMTDEGIGISPAVHATLARQYTLILASNRDEYLARPTRRPCFWGTEDATKEKGWSSSPMGKELRKERLPGSGPAVKCARRTRPSSSVLADVWAGKDLTAGGTWMGLTRTGRFGVLTNVRTPKEDSVAAEIRTRAVNAVLPPESRTPGTVTPVKNRDGQKGMPSRSRGHLVMDYLTHPDGALSPLAYAASVAGTERKGPERGGTSLLRDYAGFNLLVGDIGGASGGGVEMAYVTNKESVHNKVQILATDRLYALSNSALDVPWEKLTRGKQLFVDCLEEMTEGGKMAGEKGGIEEDDDRLAFALMDRLLQDSQACGPATDTGYSTEFESKLARICIPGVLLRHETEGTEEGGSNFGVGASAPPRFGTTASIVILVRRDGRILCFEKGLEWDAARGSHTDVWSPLRKTEARLVRPRMDCEIECT
ncbi:hypothetical protein NSK_002259 [Nannochloropsis salina CCMP1776]|uniref:DUF833 domain-containing protein n=1 Tax=Nannochloropsis salina CCMP1776 TaxID=1027361 RepID=A0A4D9D4V6_9STRA|nr:hypothetical protein NSK_002259 [Nannochloropsis salina CCMP1776]|eukprot:TFJ86602.1 hypothetical protein NSK_002259 [Nannochloropsis salina CCMP1776]